MTRGTAVALSERARQQVAVLTGPQQAPCEPQSQLLASGVQRLHREGGEGALVINVLIAEDDSYASLLHPFQCVVLLLSESCMPYLCSVLKDGPNVPDVESTDGAL